MEQLERENQRLQERLEQLEKALEEAQPAIKRQAARFSKGAPKRGPTLAGARRGSTMAPTIGARSQNPGAVGVAARW